MTKSPLPWLAGLLAVYLVAPLGALAVQLGTNGWAGLNTPGLLAALEVSATAAIVSCAIIAAGGIPLGYVLAHGRGRGISLLGSVVQLPLAMPPLAAGILLLFLVGPYSFIGSLTRGALTDSFAGIVLAQTFVASPFLVVAARSAFAAMDPSLEGVAATLGRRPWARFWHVSLPVAWPGIRSGLLLAWVRAFGEFGATAMVAYHPYSLPVYTYVQFGSTGLTTTLAPVSLAVLAALLFLSLNAWHAHARPQIAVHHLPAPRHPIVLTAEPAGQPLHFALRKRLGTFDLDVAHTAATRRLAIVGPSGAGKTLILRLLAGLDVPDHGTVSLEGIPLHTLPAEARGLGYVPQEYGLFPHLSVWQQLIFAVRADHGTARYWLDRLGLAGLEHRLPAQLSMGQRQRVALGRALAAAPRLLLLDEPFSALDAPIREAVRRDMRALQRETELASLLVTHDPSEAAFLADELIVLAEGRILQAGSVGTVFGHPASAQIARLLGIPNVHGGRIVAPGLIEAAPVRLTVADGARQPGQRVTWCVRPEDIQVGPDGPLGALVRDVIDLGGTREVLVAVDGHVELRLRTTAELTVGNTCRLTIPPDAVTVWADDTGT